MSTATNNLSQEFHPSMANAIAPYSVEQVRRDFPILHQQVHGHPLVYLDNAATSQKPRAVIDVISHYYESGNANIHRGVHFLSEHATEEHEAARRTVQRFLNAADKREIIFVRSATEGINLVAQTYGRKHVAAGDEVLISAMEHHSNIVPWQMLCEEKGAKLRVIPINDRGELQMDELPKLLNRAPRCSRSRTSPTRWAPSIPLRKIVEIAHQHNVPVVVDGAQAAPHIRSRRAGSRRRLLRLLRPQSLRPRPASACSTASRRCSKPCLPIRAAAT